MANNETKTENVLLDRATVDLTIKLAKKATTPGKDPGKEPGKDPGKDPTKVTPPTDAKGNGTVQINARPWAQVSIDGRPSGSTPKTVQLAAGSHTITLTKGSQTVTRSVVVKAGGTHQVAMHVVQG